MSKITQPIGKLNAREPKVTGAGMPSRNKETYSPSAPCHGSIPAKENVKATVNKVLSKIK